MIAYSSEGGISNQNNEAIVALRGDGSSDISIEVVIIVDTATEAATD